MRRLAADLGLIRLLVYYGSPESEGDKHEEHGHAGETFDPKHPENFWGGGKYPGLGPRARRILDIDPSLSYATLYAAGALAFNLNRPQEALDVLSYGLRRDPSNLQYHAYVAAIGFHRHGDTGSVMRILEPLLKSPDCPTMIKSMMAFLYRRTGRREKAIRLYREILETSRDPGYRRTAEKRLKALGA
jgi:tetratricopeptide (TPR) repeat protein